MSILMEEIDGFKVWDLGHEGYIQIDPSGINIFPFGEGAHIYTPEGIAALKEAISVYEGIADEPDD